MDPVLAMKSRCNYLNHINRRDNKRTQAKGATSKQARSMN